MLLGNDNSPNELSDGESSWSTTFNMRRTSNIFTLDKINRRYKVKCCRIKKIMKALIFENGALCDEVAQIQQKILVAKEERKFLAKKLLLFQGFRDASPSIQDSKPKKKPPTKRKITNKDVIEEPPKPKVSNSSNSKRKKVISLPEKRLIHPVPQDSIGRPIFPIVINGLTVHRLGEVVTDRPNFHNEEYIFPAGFCSTRVYASMKNIFQACLYTCSIVDTGGFYPRFEVVAEDDPKSHLIGSTADECVAGIYNSINQVFGKIPVDQSRLGAYFFGFGHPSIQFLIQNSPGAKRCMGYRPQRFELVKNSSGFPVETNPAFNLTILQAQIIDHIKEEFPSIHYEV